MYLYSMHGQQLAGQFSLGSEAAKEGVLDCIIYGDGLVALTGTASLPSKAKSPGPRVSSSPRLSLKGSQEALLRRALLEDACCSAHFYAPRVSSAPRSNPGA